MSKVFKPHFRTPQDQHSEVEVVKRESQGGRGTLHESFRDDQADIAWEAEQIAKSYGIYLEFNRAKTGKEKDWMYMVRLGIPGGGPLTVAQWQLLDDLAKTYAVNPEGQPSLRLTTRQAIQYHWVPKKGVLAIVKAAAEAGILSLNGCGDNVRNIMACPLAAIHGIFDSRELARELAGFFQLPAEPYVHIFAIDPQAIEQESERFIYGPQLLNRKFKIAVGALWCNPETGLVEADNCVELRTHDMGILPLWENGEVTRFQVYLGGGQGEKFGKPTAAMLSLPFAIVPREHLRDVCGAIVAVHQDYGDRENRHWARLKYVIKKKGIAWYRGEVEKLLNVRLDLPNESVDVGPRHLHHGWQVEDANGRWSFGAFIENGRLIDESPNGRLLSMVRETAEGFQTPLYLTPNQDLIFTGIASADRAAFVEKLAEYGFGNRNGQAYSALRMRSGACVGKDTCRLAYTDSEKFEPELVDALEELGWGHLHESIGITGCERQCFRPATKAIGLVGSGNNRYQFKLLGSEDGRHQGVPLVVDGMVYLRSVPRERVAEVIHVIFSWYTSQRSEEESLGEYLRRIGLPRILSYLQAHPKTLDLAEKPLPSHALNP